MASLRSRCRILLFCFIILVAQQSIIVCAESIMTPAPASAPGPSSDGKILDLGIAYVLMFGALAVTYLMHPFGSN
ncbi:hypothetical protein KP509_02G026000 [Ceratopteris richardii]|uniref:Uncharacterized protein n=1 Tax=Ceratopteris richardii TaxID=49495 RepID=A0A8T2V3Z8_CERRI|nr:hypothetical protein KP509_02G026000 [Ceratopteris richardii]